jgi:protein-tyrosine phosphatase
MKAILFICLGNICRGPAAEAILRQKAQEKGIPLLVESAGTSNYHQGEMPGHSRPLTPEDLEKFDLICGMDDQNIKNIRRLDPSGVHSHKIRKITDFAVNKDFSFVPDPYYEGDAGFELVLDILDDACTGLLQSLLTQNK